MRIVGFLILLFGTLLPLIEVNAKPSGNYRKIVFSGDEISVKKRDGDSSNVYLEQCGIVKFSYAQRGAVNVLAFLDSSWPYSHRQAIMLKILHERLKKSGLPDTIFFGVNASPHFPREFETTEDEIEKEAWLGVSPDEIERFSEIDKTFDSLAKTTNPEIRLIQDNEDLGIWQELGGSRDQVLVIDRCGKLTYQVIVPWSILHFPYVKAAILSTYNDEPCGPCDVIDRATDGFEKKFLGPRLEEIKSIQSDKDTATSSGIETRPDSTTILDKTVRNPIEDDNYSTTQFVPEKSNSTRPEDNVRGIEDDETTVSSVMFDGDFTRNNEATNFGSTNIGEEIIVSSTEEIVKTTTDEYSDDRMTKIFGPDEATWRNRISNESGIEDSTHPISVTSEAIVGTTTDGIIFPKIQGNLEFDEKTLNIQSGENTKIEEDKNENYDTTSPKIVIIFDKTTETISNTPTTQSDHFEDGLLTSKIEGASPNSIIDSDVEKILSTTIGSNEASNPTTFDDIFDATTESISNIPATQVRHFENEHSTLKTEDASLDGVTPFDAERIYSTTIADYETTSSRIIADYETTIYAPLNEDINISAEKINSTTTEDYESTSNNAYDNISNKPTEKIFNYTTSQFRHFEEGFSTPKMEDASLDSFAEEIPSTMTEDNESTSRNSTDTIDYTTIKEIVESSTTEVPERERFENDDSRNEDNAKLSQMPIRIIMHAPHFHTDSDSTRMHEYLVLKTGIPRRHSHLASYDATRLYSGPQDYHEEASNTTIEEIEKKEWSMKNLIYNKDESTGLFGEIADYWRDQDSLEDYEDVDETERPVDENNYEEGVPDEKLWKESSKITNGRLGLVEGTVGITEGVQADETATENLTKKIQSEDFNPEEEETRNKLIAHYSKLLPWIYYVLEK